MKAIFHKQQAQSLVLRDRGEVQSTEIIPSGRLNRGHKVMFLAVYPIARKIALLDLLTHPTASILREQL